MDVSLFDFDLPSELIAIRPARPRDSARMLVVDSQGRLTHSTIKDIARFLRQGDNLVSNDTRVMKARLWGTREARPGGQEIKVEVLLCRRLDTNSFEVMARPTRRLRPGDSLNFDPGLSAVIETIGTGGSLALRFNKSGQALDSSIESFGEMPLPPYIARARPVDAMDDADYQTIFAKHEGSVAAPTAGLHFTGSLLNDLRDHGIKHETITLHVGPGTFLPVTAADTTSHHMHRERATIGASAASHLNQARSAGGRIVAVGTTSLRTLESAALADGTIECFDGSTDIFITPGYRFRATDVLLTNFHLPRSTLFMLVSAFSGIDVMKRAYTAAIEAHYRFYSYGDACLLFRPPHG